MKRILLLNLLAIPAIGMDAPLPAKAKAPAAQAQAQDQEAIECTICMDDIKGGDSFSKTPCGHTFHYKCFNEFSLSNARYSCPNCRGQLTDENLTQLRNAASGTLPKSDIPAAPVIAQAPADLLTRVINVFSPSLPVIPVNEVTQKLMQTTAELRQIKQTNKALEIHAQGLGEIQHRVEENLRADLARLGNKNRILQDKIKALETSHEQNLRKVKSSIPEHAQVLALQDSITALAKERDELNAQIKSLQIRLSNASNSNEELRSLVYQLEEIKAGTERANKALVARYKELQELSRRVEHSLKSERNYFENAMLYHRNSKQALRERLVTISSFGIGALSGYLAYKFTAPDYSSMSAIFAGATGLIGTHIFGTKYINKCFAQEQRTIENFPPLQR